jgi:hypothetical protein
LYPDLEYYLVGQHGMLINSTLGLSNPMMTGLRQSAKPEEPENAEVNFKGILNVSTEADLDPIGNWNSFTKSADNSVFGSRKKDSLKYKKPYLRKSKT